MAENRGLAKRMVPSDARASMTPANRFARIISGSRNVARTRPTTTQMVQRGQPPSGRDPVRRCLCPPGRAEAYRARLRRFVYHSGSTMEPVFAAAPFTMVANVTGQPSMSLPLHWTDDGLPMGLLFTASGIGDEALEITLSDPADPSRVLVRRSMRQMALSASGIRKGDHIVDPRTGQDARLGDEQRRVDPRVPLVVW